FLEKVRSLPTSTERLFQAVVSSGSAAFSRPAGWDRSRCECSCGRLPCNLPREEQPITFRFLMRLSPFRLPRHRRQRLLIPARIHGSPICHPQGSPEAAFYQACVLVNLPVGFTV